MIRRMPQEWRDAVAGESDRSRSVTQVQQPANETASPFTRTRRNPTKRAVGRHLLKRAGVLAGKDKTRAPDHSTDTSDD